MQGNRAYPPRVTSFTEHFWKALGEGRFETTRCAACSELSFPPKQICPRCWHSEMRWVEINPQGWLYSWTRIYAGPAVFESELPYAVGLVDLRDGIRVAVRLTQPGGQEWACDEEVRLIRLDYDDGPLIGATKL